MRKLEKIFMEFFKIEEPVLPEGVSRDEYFEALKYLSIGTVRGSVFGKNLEMPITREQVLAQVEKKKKEGK